MPDPAPPCICTVATRSELAHARVLARSLDAAHPGARLRLLLLDDPGERQPSDEEPFQLLRPGQVGLEPERFEHLAALCPPPGLRAIGRAWLLRFLCAETGLPQLYLDPTSRIFGPLEEALGALEDHDLLLTPTLTAPIEDDGRRPGREEIASWGAYDAGLIGIGAAPGPEELLEWWADQSAAQGEHEGEDPFALSQLSWWIEEEARVRTAEVVPAPGFAPSRLLDLAAGIAKHPYLLTDPGYTAGYWNLAGRSVSEADGYGVDGRPLRTFNFRGFDPARPSMLSRHQDRISLADSPGLARLCASYAAELSEQGLAECAAIPYAFDALPDGTRFSARLRRLYREWSESGAIAVAPFSERGQRAFFGWLAEPPSSGATEGANRYLFAVYLEREDLHRALPPGLPDFGERLAAWARGEGRTETEIPAALIPPAEAGTEGAGEQPPRPALRRRVPFEHWGVNVVGFHRFDFGIAQAGRLAIDALDARAIPLLPIHDLSLGRYKAAGPPFATLGLEAAAFPINLLCMNGDHAIDLAERAGTGLFEKHYTIALWFWEADRLPDAWLPAFELLDEVWAPSAYVAEVVSKASPVPVNQVRLPVTVRPAAPLDRAAYGIGEDEFLFLYMFDFDSVGTRKNPLGAVEAFKQAFPPGSGVKLLLKSSFSQNAISHFEALRQAVAEHPDVLLVDGRVSPAERDALLAGCDCYVSLHRSEGLGLTPAEAMLYARPVIATGYGGVTDFITPENGYLVDYELIPVGEGLAPYPAGAHWADPDTSQAADLMREVFENREEARARGMRAAEELQQSHSPEAAGMTMEKRLAQIRARFLPEPSPVTPPRASFGQRLVNKLRRGRAPEQPAPEAGEAQLPGLSAALLAQVRSQERRVQDLEHARPRPRAERLPDRAEP